MKRRELFSKLFGVAATGAMTATGLSALESKPASGEWYISGMPICPECGMAMDTSPREENGNRRVFMHPEYIGGEQQKRWPCKNAGRKFYLPTSQLVEYEGEMKRPSW